MANVNFKAVQGCGESFYRVYDVRQKEHNVVMTANVVDDANGSLIQVVWANVIKMERLECYDAIHEYIKNGPYTQ